MSKLIQNMTENYSTSAAEAVSQGPCTAKALSLLSRKLICSAAQAGSGSAGSGSARRSRREKLKHARASVS